MDEKRTVLVVGGTGHLGRKVVRGAIGRGWHVRALVRNGTPTEELTALGASVARGDMLDRSSIDRAMAGCAAVLSTAIGYSNRRKGDLASGTDTTGNHHLIDAAAASGVGRFVFCSVLTCDKAPRVPHFWNKKLVEDYLQSQGVPFVALRPGAFLDQGPGDFWAAGLKKGKLRFAANAGVAATFVHTSDVATCLVQALDIKVEAKAVSIDIGADGPVSIDELAQIMTKILGRRIKPQVPPWPVVRVALGIAGLFNPWQRDLLAMMEYFQTGGYVADVSKQRKYFGVVPTIEASVDRYLTEVGLKA